jgi:hypothetical protein
MSIRREARPWDFMKDVVQNLKGRVRFVRGEYASVFRNVASI